MVKYYTYEPFGNVLEFGEADPNMKNPFMFTGQYYDSEIDEYYLRARMYDPLLGRFTARDPVRGKYKEPMTLHVYLYCINDPINKTDPSGELWGALDQARRVAYGTSAYYVGLDESLKAAGGSWERILDAAIFANSWRETYFAPENLRNLRGSFGAKFNVFGALGGSSICDWGPLAGCIGAGYLEGLMYEAPLVIIGEISCAICATSFEPISKTGFCIGCAIYRYSNPARIAANIVMVADCVSKHCNW